MGNMLVAIPALMVAQSIDMNDPNNVLYIRGGFLLMSAIQLLLTMHIKSKVEEAKDETEIVVTIPKTFMTPGSEERTTYYEWESKKADEAKSQVFQ